jgi:hypothetical protein
MEGIQMRANISKKEFGSRVINDDGEIIAENLTVAMARQIAAVPDLISALRFCIERLGVLQDAEEATDLDIEAYECAVEAFKKTGIEL